MTGRYRPEIDGLRAIAVLPVVLFHAKINGFGGGFIGVDVFFVISGFLISRIILADLEANKFSIGDFYMRRARRILPALFTVILVTLPFAWLWLLPENLVTFAESIFWVATFTSNIYFWRKTDYFAADADLQPLLHTWSLGVEEQYYIFFPILILVLWRWRRSWIFPIILIVAVASFLLSVWGMSNYRSATFFLLPTRGWELLAGVVATLLLMGRWGGAMTTGWWATPLALVGLALIGIPIFIYNEETAFPGVAALPPVIGTFLLLLFARHDTLVGKFLSLRPLVWFGLISYSTYLWHQPIFALTRYRFGDAIFDHSVVLLIGLSIILAVATYFIIETPFRRRLKTPYFFAVTTSGIAATVLAAVLLSQAVERSPSRLPAYQAALAAAGPQAIAALEDHQSRPLWQDCIEEYGQACSAGDLSVSPTVVVWGDSNAWALWHGLDVWGKNNGIGFVIYMAPGCPPVLGLENLNLEECHPDVHRRVFHDIMHLEEIELAVILGLERAGNARNLRIDSERVAPEIIENKVVSIVGEFAARSTRTVYVEHGILFDEWAGERFIRSSLLGQAEALSIAVEEFQEFVAPVRALEPFFDSYVRTEDFFCTEGRCSSVDANGQFVIFDRNHVTRLYSEKLAHYLAKELGL